MEITLILMVCFADDEQQPKFIFSSLESEYLTGLKLSMLKYACDNSNVTWQSFGAGSVIKQMERWAHTNAALILSVSVQSVIIMIIRRHLVKSGIKVRGWTYQISGHLIFLHKSRRWRCILQREVSIKDSSLYMWNPCLLPVESLKRSNAHFIRRPARL